MAGFRQEYDADAAGRRSRCPPGPLPARRAAVGAGVRRMADGSGPQVAGAQGAAGLHLGGGLPAGRARRPGVRGRAARVRAVAPREGAARDLLVRRVLAQRWLFRRSSAGDLSAILHWYFDTAHADRSRIPRATGGSPRKSASCRPDILFVSDVVAELDAAREAGMGTILSVRPGNAPQPPHDIASSAALMRSRSLAKIRAAQCPSPCSVVHRAVRKSSAIAA